MEVIKTPLMSKLGRWGNCVLDRFTIISIYLIALIFMAHHEDHVWIIIRSTVRLSPICLVAAEEISDYINVILLKHYHEEDIREYELKLPSSWTRYCLPDKDSATILEILLPAPSDCNLKIKPLWLTLPKPALKALTHDPYLNLTALFAPV